MKRRTGSIVTIGSFDGVHRGHMALLDRTVMEAQKRNLKSVALTFSMPPRMVLDQSENKRVLSNINEKELLLRSRGIDQVVSLDFSKDFSKTKPYSFFRDILLNRFKAKGIVVGLDFRFGADRSAGAIELVRWGEEVRIPIWVIHPIKHGRDVVSSSLIRAYLAKDNLQKALPLLGHPYLIEGKVITGRGLGKRLGYPTLNMKPDVHKLIPRGVFAVRGRPANSSGPFLEGVCNIGTRPTFYKSSAVVIEPYWFNYGLQKPPKTMFIELVHRLRSEKKFPTSQKLQKAIAEDIRKARLILAKDDEKASNFRLK